MSEECCGPGYASPAEAIKAPREKLLYSIAIYTGTGIQKPDYLVTIDADPDSDTYSQVIHRLEMPGIGDELHHMGWNACSSCHDDSSMSRKYLLVPGVRSSNIHIVDTATDPRAPRLHKVIDGAEIKTRTNLNLLDRPCLEEPEEGYSVERCSQDWMTRRVGCLAPWQNANETDDWKMCETKEDFDGLVKVHAEVLWMASQDLVNVSGCLPPCKLHDFQVSWTKLKRTNQC